MLTVVAATDLTDRSAQVAGRAQALVAANGTGRIVLAHVAAAGTTPVRLAALQKQLQAAAVAAPGPVLPEVVVLTGRPEQVLPDLVAREGADLLILGLHRVRRVLDLLRLTTMERIVLATDVPVLVAHLPAARPYARVLASVDFAPACAASLAAAGRLAPDAEFHAIHALHMPLRDRLSPLQTQDTAAVTQAGLLRRAFMDSPGLPPSLHLPEIVPGGVHEVLAFRIEELEPDLVVIGTHSGRDPTMLGNYARDLMRDPPVDVLVTKPPVARAAA